MFLFYYIMTYTISFMCANWYYGIQGSNGSLLRAYKLMFKQFGSLVCAALVIAVVTFMRMVIDENRQRRARNRNHHRGGHHGQKETIII